MLADFLLTVYRQSEIYVKISVFRNVLKTQFEFI